MSLLNRVVLVVDDDPDICWALEHLLGKLGARCIRAIDGQTALLAAGANQLDLVLLDAKLPELNGLEVARGIRCADPGVPIMLVSGYFYQDDPAIRTALEQGLICGFVEKPFSHAAIVTTMEAALCSQKVASGATETPAVDK